MVNDILTLAGFVKNETFRAVRFTKPPKSTYAVYHDSVERGGGDTVALYKRHSVTIEIYSYSPDPSAEALIEAQLDAFYPLMIDGWSKQDVYWIEEEKLYQVIYEFEYFEK